VRADRFPYLDVVTVWWFVPERLFSRALWQRVNEQFRSNGQFYVEAPRRRRYRRKARLMLQRFPRDETVTVQAAYLAKNLVNIQRFPDANKRTTSVLLEVFLETNGYRLVATDEEYVRFLMDVQRRVPADQWDGRTFSLKAEYIPWKDDAYHRFLVEWMHDHVVSKR
jgi:death-on-curing family protein